MILYISKLVSTCAVRLYALLKFPSLWIHYTAYCEMFSAYLGLQNGLKLELNKSGESRLRTSL